MRFLSDYCQVHFPNLGISFDVYENFLEFPFGGDTITIKFYGLIIAFGFILAALFGGRKAYEWKLSLDHMVDVLIYGIFGAVIGARLYYVAFQWDYYKNDLLSIFKIWEGGLAIYGGIIGGIIVVYFVCKNKSDIYLHQDIPYDIHNLPQQLSTLIVRYRQCNHSGCSPHQKSVLLLCYADG